MLNVDFRLVQGFLLFYGVPVMLMGLIGLCLGRYKSRPGAGFLLGLLLGPLGWLLILLFESGARKCPKCFGAVHSQASRCRHCGGELLALKTNPFRRRVL